MLTAVATLGGLSLVLAILIIQINKHFAVDVDPREETVEAMLPGANCGACGYVGCQQFTQALLRGETQPGQCSVSGEKEREQIADFLGVDVGAINHMVARLACAGGTNVARRRADYAGLETCQAAAQVAGGAKACTWGCLGLGDCQRICEFSAITMDTFELPRVDESLCTGCGDCVDVCPKSLFSLHPMDHKLWVACSNLEFGDETLKACEVACTSCGRCAIDAPACVRMENNIAVVDYQQTQDKTAIDRCPTGAIVWFDKAQELKGPQAKKVLRQSELKPMAS